MAKIGSIATRVWLPSLIVIAPVACVVLLFYYRSDPKFSVISTTLGVLLGISATAAIQLVSQGRMRRLQLEDEQRQRERSVVQKRVERVREHFTARMAQEINIVKLLRILKAAHAGGNQSLVEQNQASINKLLEGEDSRINVEGLASARAFNNPKLDALEQDLENALRDFRPEDGPPILEDEEFEERFVVFAQNSVKILGAVYAELDKIDLAGKLPD